MRICQLASNLSGQLEPEIRPNRALDLLNFYIIAYFTGYASSVAQIDAESNARSTTVPERNSSPNQYIGFTTPFSLSKDTEDTKLQTISAEKPSSPVSSHHFDDPRIPSPSVQTDSTNHSEADDYTTSRLVYLIIFSHI